MQRAYSRTHPTPNDLLPRGHGTGSCRYVRAAWLGAIIEGEGSVVYQAPKNTDKAQLRLMVYNTEVETIATTLRLAGCGGVYTNTPTGGRKRKWIWSATGVQAAALLTDVIPFLTGKQGRALDALVDLIQRKPAVRYMTGKLRSRMLRTLSSYRAGFRSPPDRSEPMWIKIGH